MKNALLYIWQLPQHILGLILLGLLRPEKKTLIHNGKTLEYYEYAPDSRVRRLISSGGSYGRYIIMPTRQPNDMHIRVPHEWGHSLQSLRLGWLYLLVIGFYSAVFCNLWSRVHCNGWEYERYQRWYYSRWTEAWADKLGEVNRGQRVDKPNN